MDKGKLTRWKPKFPGQPYFETAAFRRNGSRHADRMVKWRQGDLRATRVWSSTDTGGKPIFRGTMVRNGRNTEWADDPYGRFMQPAFVRRLALKGAPL